MAKSTKSTPSKTRAGAKTKPRVSAKKEGAPQRRGARARAASKKSAPKQVSRTEGWASSVGSLLTSQPGREILADVLDAAAGVLRRNREVAQQVVASGEAAVESGRELATAAFRAGTTAADEVAAATRGVAETAAGALAELAGEALRTLMPESTSRTGGSKRGTRKGSGKARAGGG
jgi:hypothetical protein